MTPPTKGQPRPKRPLRFRVSLRIFMVLVAGFGAWLGMKANEARKMRRALSEIRRVGGHAYFDFEINKKGFPDIGLVRKSPWYERLIGPEYFHRVDTVELASVDKAGSARPLRIANLSRLADLGEVRRVRMDLTGADDLVMSTFPRIAGLKILEIQETGIGDPGLEWLSQYQGQGLEALEIVGGRLKNRIGDATARRVGRITSLTKLEIYGGAGLTDSGIASLSGLRSLTQLVLHGDHLGNETLKTVASLPNLEILNVRGLARAQRDGFEPLSGLSNLTHLSLAGQSLSEWDLGSVARLKRLSSVSLISGTLGPRAFAGLPAACRISRINIDQARVSERAVANLERLDSLSEVHFFRADVSDEAVQRLAAKRTTLKVSRIGPYLPYP